MQPPLIGTWLSEQLRATKRSMRQVAEYTGISPSTVHNIIVGKYVPKPATCIKLAEYFRVDSDVVLELAGHRPPRREDDLPDFHMYISRKFGNDPRLQRALIAAYEAIRSVEEEQAEKARARDAEYEEWLREREEQKKRRDEGHEP